MQSQPIAFTQDRTQPISFPQDRKYRPDLEPVRSSQVGEAASTSSPRSLSYASDTTEQGGNQQRVTIVGKEVLLRPPELEAAPPIYVPE
jgi:hypothetical protein